MAEAGNAPSPKPIAALLVGATGLVGSELLQLLVADRRFEPVITLTRRPLSENLRSDKLQSHVIDFEQPDKWADHCRADVVFCALGTTIKKAGSREAFRRVDHDYPMMVARAALEQGARHYLLVSALDASRKSKFFYSRVKGEVEADLIELGYSRLSIFRPSLLVGPREEFRPLETLFGAIAPVVPRKYKPIEGLTVARGMIERALAEDVPPLEIIDSAEIKKIAD